MAVLGNLILNVKARTEQAQSKLKNFRKSTKESTISLGRLGKMSASTAAKFTLIATAAVKATQIALREFNKLRAELDSLAKHAAKVGTNVEDLVRLRHAAGLSGVGASTLDTAIQRFARRSAEAAQGTGEAVKALKELGLEAKSLQQLSTFDQFLELSRAFQRIDNPTDRLRIAFKLFDTEGAGLVNMLKDGPEALQEMAGHADGMARGLNEAAKKAEQINDNLANMGARAEGDPLRLAFRDLSLNIGKAVTDFLADQGYQTSKGRSQDEAMAGVLKNLSMIRERKDEEQRKRLAKELRDFTAELGRQRMEARRLLEERIKQRKAEEQRWRYDNMRTSENRGIDPFGSALRPQTGSRGHGRRRIELPSSMSAGLNAALLAGSQAGRTALGANQRNQEIELSQERNRLLAAIRADLERQEQPEALN